MKVTEVLDKKLKGLYYGNRLILPFRAHFLKVIIDNEIITDFSPLNSRVRIIENETFTDIYVGGIKDITDEVSKYEAVKMVVVEKGADLFNFDNHLKIALYFEEKHSIKIEKTDEDILFIE